MEHKTSVREYRPKIKHHCQVAERHERAARRVKNKKKREHHVRIARKHRRVCVNLARIWGQQCAWNRDNWQYVIYKLYGPPDPSVESRVNDLMRTLARESRLEEDSHKARSYDFQHNEDLRNPQAEEEYECPWNPFLWDEGNNWTEEDWDKWEEELECSWKESNRSSTPDNPESSS